MGAVFTKPAASEQHDTNFCFPLRELENDHVKVTPFVPYIHAQPFWEGTQDHPEIFSHLPVGPFRSLDALLASLEGPIHCDPTLTVLAILDKSACTESSPTPPLAAIIGFIDADPRSLSVEVGMLICLPAFQRKRIMYSAVALILQYCLTLPSEGGLGLRRVQYQANTSNEASIAFAKKIGFRFEGVHRWHRVLHGDKLGNGRPERVGDVKPGAKGRDTATLALCWDDWEEGLKEKICLPEYKMYTN